MAFFKKKEAKGNEQQSINSVTESLYKQNLELAVKNKTLSLLRKLYDISLLSLKTTELAEKLTKTIEEDLEHELVGISLLNKSNDSLDPLAFAKSSRFENVEKSFGKLIDKTSISAFSKNIFFKEIKINSEPGYTEELRDIWDSLIPQEMYEKFSSESHVKSAIVYSLAVANKHIGFLILCLNRDYKHLVEFERESIKIIVNLIAVALDKAMIYEELKVTNEKLESSNSQLENLVHFISHEVKGALGKTRGTFSEILEGDFGKMPEEMNNLVKSANDDTENAIEMVMNILKSSDLKSGKIKLDLKPFDLKLAIINVLKKLESDINSKKLELIENLSDEPCIILGDQELIGMHVIKNLIDNSIKYTPSGSITVNLSRKNDKVLFSLKDTGIGLTPEDKSKLFTEGGKGENSTKVNVHSTGYGLFFAKGIVESHGGRIWAESDGAGKGSSFFAEFKSV